MISLKLQRIIMEQVEAKITRHPAFFNDRISTPKPNAAIEMIVNT